MICKLFIYASICLFCFYYWSLVAILTAQRNWLKFLSQGLWLCGPSQHFTIISHVYRYACKCPLPFSSCLPFPPLHVFLYLCLCMYSVCSCRCIPITLWVGKEHNKYHLDESQDFVFNLLQGWRKKTKFLLYWLQSVKLACRFFWFLCPSLSRFFCTKRINITKGTMILSSPLAKCHDLIFSLSSLTAKCIPTPLINAVPSEITRWAFWFKNFTSACENK